MILFFWLILFTSSIAVKGSLFLNILAVTSFLLLIVHFFKKEKIFFVLSSFFTWSLFTTAFSCLILETGVYLPEIGEFSSLNGATAINISTAAFTLIMASKFFSFLDNRIPANLNTSFSINNVLDTIYPFIVLVAIFIVIYISIHYGRPSDFGQDRFFYWNNIAPAWGNSIRLIVEQSSFILGCLYAKSKRKNILVIYFMGVLSQVLVGEKFTGIFQMIIFFGVSYLIAGRVNIRSKVLSTKNITLVLIMVVVFGLLIWSSYFSLSNNSDIALESLKTRIASQSQIWWKLTELSQQNSLVTFDFFKNFFGVGANSDSTGMLYLMSLVMPEKLYQIYEDAGIALTMAFPANVLFFFSPIIALLVCSILAIYLALALWFTSVALKNKDIILLFIAMKVYNISIQFLLMGRVYILFEWKAVLFFIPLAYAFILSKKKRTE